MNDQTNLVARTVKINGVVQAVGFRPFIYRIAVNNNLSGWVKNLGDAGVEIFVQGENNDIDNFLHQIPKKKPPLAQIEEVRVQPAPVENNKGDFHIRPSSSGSSGSGIIPPDIAICDECLDDVFSATRYENYWATSCVNCGPRFTVIEELPYDRDKTSMDDFPMCNNCRQEYTDPLDRRYHAQTIACQECGPRLWFEDEETDQVEGMGAIERTARFLQGKKIVAIKGIGGCHLACDASKTSVVRKLRRRLTRPQQPFALMATKEMIDDLVISSPREMRLLTSPRRPIVVMKISAQSSLLSSEIAPGLNTVGIMLPYTGLHHLLFQTIDFPLVMTSANMPGEPMNIDSGSIKREMKQIADGFLLHDRKIISRCDDSVIRNSSGSPKFLRRSRGWVPEPIEVDLGPEPILAVGAEQDNVLGLYRNNKVFLSQYLGNTDDPQSVDFFHKALDRLLVLTNSKLPRTVVHDLHPAFLTTKLAREIGKNSIAIQHHEAHLGALMAEHDLSRAVGIIADGLGYGSDENIWGGEVISSTPDQIVRKGSLSPVYMPGGDLATKHPARLVPGILYPLVEQGKLDSLSKYLNKLQLEFPNGERERRAVLVQLGKKVNCPITTSAGRFLDAVSAALNCCSFRNYEGEPAMKLEALAATGTVHKFPLPLIQNRDTFVLNQSEVFVRLLEMLDADFPPEDIAATAQWALATGLSKIAVTIASELEIDTVGFSGGVAYNDYICSTVEQEITSRGKKFITNEKVPPGDGGIAFGQLWVAANHCSI